MYCTVPVIRRTCNSDSISLPLGQSVSEIRLAHLGYYLHDVVTFLHVGQRNAMLDPAPGVLCELKK